MVAAASDDRNRTDVLKALSKSTARVEHLKARGTQITATVECNTAQVPSVVVVVVVITSRWWETNQCKAGNEDTKQQEEVPLPRSWHPFSWEVLLGCMRVWQMLVQPDGAVADQRTDSGWVVLTLRQDTSKHRHKATLAGQLVLCANCPSSGPVLAFKLKWICNWAHTHTLGTMALPPPANLFNGPLFSEF